MLIPVRAGYIRGMEQLNKTVRLRLEEGEGVQALEAVLAIVRRGAVEVLGLSMAPGRHGMMVQLKLRADEDALHLCRTRLCNVIGIAWVKVCAGGDGSDPAMGCAPTVAAGLSCHNACIDRPMEKT